MAVEIKVPEMGESVAEATVVRWLKAAGEAVAAGEPLVELETDKVNLEVPSPVAGVLEAQRQGEGATVAVGDLLATVTEGTSAPQPASPLSPPAPAATSKPAAAEPAAARPPAPSAPPSMPLPAPTLPPPAAPTVRQMARAEGIDLSRLTGSGPGGRIQRQDLPAAQSGGTTTEALEADEPVERQPMSRRRLTIARRLVEAQHTAAMLTTFNEVDMSRVMAIRSQYKDAFKERHGVALGFMSFFTRATVEALKAFPRLNAEIAGEEIWLKRYYHIGVAVSTDEGLVVPVIRHADRLSFAEIEREIQRLAKRARERQLTIADLRGGTFTITNGGVFGSLFSTPILNQPEVGILGMHTIQERPVAVGGQVEVRPMMYLAVTYDHRIVDGAEAVQFLVHIKHQLESPERLLLEI